MSVETETAPVAEIPTPAEDAVNPEQPGYVGQLETGEMQLLNSLRQASTQVVLKIGQLEVQKAQLLGQLDQIENRSRSVVTGATKRFGVEGNQWNIQPDGKVFKVEG